MTREEFVREWCADLRSGKYTQYKGSLRDAVDPHCCCCLGVACYTAVRLGVPGAGPPEPCHFLPAEWFTNLVGSTNPILGVHGEVSVAELNDAKGWDFAKIADALEAKYLKS